MNIGDSVMLRMGPRAECGTIIELREWRGSTRAVVRIARSDFRWHDVLRTVSLLEAPPHPATTCNLCGRWYWPGVTANSDMEHCSDACFDGSLQVNPRRHGYSLGDIRQRNGYDPDRDPEDPHNWAY